MTAADAATPPPSAGTLTRRTSSRAPAVATHSLDAAFGFHRVQCSASSGGAGERLVGRLASGAGGFHLRFSFGSTFFLGVFAFGLGGGGGGGGGGAEGHDERHAVDAGLGRVGGRAAVDAGRRRRVGVRELEHRLLLEHAGCLVVAAEGLPEDREVALRGRRRQPPSARGTSKPQTAIVLCESAAALPK